MPGSALPICPSVTACSVSGDHAVGFVHAVLDFVAHAIGALHERALQQPRAGVGSPYRGPAGAVGRDALDAPDRRPAIEELGLCGVGKELAETPFEAAIQQMRAAGLDLGEGAQVVDAQPGVGARQLVHQVVGDALAQVAEASGERRASAHAPCVRFGTAGPTPS